jgi:hypothetical protein
MIENYRKILLIELPIAKDTPSEAGKSADARWHVAGLRFMNRPMGSQKNRMFGVINGEQNG